jgi:hypothetical protein
MNYISPQSDADSSQMNLKKIILYKTLFFLKKKHKNRTVGDNVLSRREFRFRLTRTYTREGNIDIERNHNMLDHLGIALIN